MDLKFMDKVKKIIYAILRKENILQGQWHMGKVEEVLSNKLLSVYIDGSDEAQKIPCNPDVSFSQEDKVFVLYVNGNSKDKFVPFKRGI
jgi:hypothetical protein